MDRYDRDILRLLRKNARVTHSEVSQRVHLSIPAVSERVRKLEQGGYIRGFTALLVPEKFGIGLTAYISVSLEHPRYIEDFLEAVQNIHDVLECHHVAGDEDYLLKIMTQNTAALELLLHRIKQINGIRKTKTAIVLSTIKEEASICVPGE